jgi:DNA topoisomerase-1
MDGETMTLDQAVGLLSLPRLVGIHPETGQNMEAGLGRFGPYIKKGSIFASLDKDDDILAIGVNRAVDVIGRKLASVRIVGQHPKDKTDIQVRKGRFGPYLQHGQVVANLPKNVTMDDVTMEQAVALLAERGKLLKPKGKNGRAAPAKKAGPAKTAAPPHGAAAKAAAPKAAARAKPKAKPAAKKAPAVRKAG